MPQAQQPLTKKPARALTASVFVITIALLVIVLAGIPGLLEYPMLSLTLRVLAGVALTLILWFYAYSAHVVPMRLSHRPAHRFALPQDQAERLQASVARQLALDPVQAMIFVHSVISPSQLRHRIVDQYDAERRTLRQTVSVEARVPAMWMKSLMKSRPDSNTVSAVSVLLPIILPTKGELLDNFELRGADGAALPAVSYQEYLQVVARIIQTLANACFGATDTETEEAMRLALGDILSRGPAERPRTAGANAIRNLERHERRVKPQLLGLIASLVEQLAERYAIVAAVPVDTDGRVAFQYQRTIIPTLSMLSAHGLGRFKERLRMLLGARPVSVSVPLESAWTAQSYHLRVNSEDGLYLAFQDAPGLEDYLTTYVDVMTKLPVAEQPPAPPHYRFQSRFGQSFAHFYCRFFPEPFVPRSQTGVTTDRSQVREAQRTGERHVPCVTIGFLEMPPGSAFRAMIAAMASAALIWSVGLMAARGGPLTDAPTILLAVPAAAAAWLGYEGSRHRLLEATLASRLSLAATFILSLIASCLFMTDTLTPSAAQSASTESLSLLGIHGPFWAALTVAAFINAGIIAFTYAVRSWEFVHLSQRENRFTSVTDAQLPQTLTAPARLVYASNGGTTDDDS